MDRARSAEGTGPGNERFRSRETSNSLIQQARHAAPTGRQALRHERRTRWSSRFPSP
jgi:hypothetical protein